MNRRHGRGGHLFQSRYKSVLAADNGYWMNLSMYIHLNPVRAMLVSDPGEYYWSSFMDYTRQKPRFSWLKRERVLALYGNDDISGRRRYCRRCLDLSGRDPGFWERFRIDVILGSKEAYDKLLKKHRPAGDPSGVPDYSRARRTRDVGAALERVADAFGVDVDELKRRRSGKPLRLAAYYHLVNNCGVCSTEVGREFGVGVSAVSMGVRRIEQMMEDDPGLADKIKGLCEM